jgi:amidohydrolase
MRPTLERVAGPGRCEMVSKVTGAEDFSFFQRVIPGLFFFVGVTPEGIDPAKTFSNHSPKFFADERALPVGVRALAHLACDFLESSAAPLVR